MRLLMAERCQIHINMRVFFLSVSDKIEGFHSSNSTILYTCPYANRYNWHMYKRIILTVFVFLCLFQALCCRVEAQSAALEVIQTTYKDTYTVGIGSSVSVDREVSMENLTAKVFVSEFAFSFSNPDRMSDIVIFEDGAPADFSSDKSKNGTLLVQVRFKNPAVGNGVRKKLIIRYSVRDMLEQQGIFRELYIPVGGHSASERLNGYSIVVKVPAGFPSAGIAKPAIKQLSNTEYIWADVKAYQKKNLYLSFSTQAFYAVELKYALVNSSPYTKHLSIPFVPEGIYQKVYVTAISPEPVDTTIDEDGNYLGVFSVAGNSVENVVFKAVVELTNKPNEELKKYHVQLQQATGLTRYLTPEKYWSLEESVSSKITESLVNPFAIYQFTIDTLEYDTARVNDKNLERMGAQWAFSNPKNAVCMEYTDLFIAVAREQGIPAREVVGYAITNDETLLPVSFLGDILHAWPEYYDKAREMWTPVDPTWEDTSHIDYFSTFDLNHIALVYHGKDTTYPLPPGVYKVKENTKDVSVKPAENAPIAEGGLEVQLPSKIELRAGVPNKVRVTINSKSNVFLYNIGLYVSDKKTDTSAKSKVNQISIPVLEPYGSKEIEVEFFPLSTGFYTTGNLAVYLNGQLAATHSYRAIAGWMHSIFVYRGFILGASVFIILFALVKKWR